MPGEIVIDAEWYDYEAKYEPGGMELVVPGPAARAVARAGAPLAVEVFPPRGLRRHGALRLLRGGP